MTELDQKYGEMVAKLMKPGAKMMEEFTNNQKQAFKDISDCITYASELWDKCWLHFPMYSNPLDYELHHMVLGINGELGELLDSIKKWAVYCRERDNKNIEEELGDLMFYMVGFSIVFNKSKGRYLPLMEDFNELGKSIVSLSISLGFDLAKCKEQNMAKLAERYKGYQYTDEQAKERNDKKVRYVDMEFNVSGEIVKVAYFPDEKKVCWPETMEIMERFDAACGHSFDHELLVQMCEDKLKKSNQ